MPIRITIRGHVYDITKLLGGNKRKLLDYSHSRRAPNMDSFLMYNNKKVGTHKLLFHLAVHFITFRVFPQMHAVSVSRRNLFIGYRFFYCDAVRGYATFVYSTSLQPCTSCNLFQGKKMFFLIITQYPFFAVSGYCCNRILL